MKKQRIVMWGTYGFLTGKLRVRESADEIDREFGTESFPVLVTPIKPKRAKRKGGK